MFLAIPGKITKLNFDDGPIALVDVSGVRRRVNVDLLRNEGLGVGDSVLIHVGFAMSKISESEADEQMRLLAMMGEIDAAVKELEGSDF